MSKLIQSSTSNSIGNKDNITLVSILARQGFNDKGLFLRLFNSICQFSHDTHALVSNGRRFLIN